MLQRLSLLPVCLMMAACTPALDWRDVRPAQSRIEAQFPCKPKSASRAVTLAGAHVEMTVHACVADAVTWGLGVADVADPALVAPALLALATALQAQAQVPARTQPLHVPGMTPQAGTTRLAMTRRRDGAGAVQVHVALFSKGTRVYQASAIGERPSAQALETFFGALRLPS